MVDPTRWLNTSYIVKNKRVLVSLTPEAYELLVSYTNKIGRGMSPARVAQDVLVDYLLRVVPNDYDESIKIASHGGVRDGAGRPKAD